MKKIRNSKATKIIAYYLVIMMFLQVTQPMQMYALTSGPSQPEFNSFTPIGTSDMVDLASGDFNYNIPIMDVGGYPINLSYSSGVTMDQEASWVGLGWNLNIGQINRNVRGLPDDFNGDEIENINNLKKNLTVGVQGYFNTQLIGLKDKPKTGATASSSSGDGNSSGNGNSSTSLPSLTGGISLQYNNYTGTSAIPSLGLTFGLSNQISAGMQLTSSSGEGVTINPSISLSTKEKNEDGTFNKFSGSISPSISYNSRQGLTSFNLSSNVKDLANKKKFDGIIGNVNGNYSYQDILYTPTKRNALKNGSGSMSFSIGPDVFGAHVELTLSGSVSIQELVNKTRSEKAFGYEHTHNASNDDLLDFNRENEQPIVSSSTLALPITNYTYDILNIQSQVLGGTFRANRGQVGYVYTGRVSDYSNSLGFGMEYEGGGGFHVGANIKFSHSDSNTGLWNTTAVNYFKEKISGNHINYENVYYKNVGELRVDDEYSTLFTRNLGGESPIILSLDNTKNASNQYYRKNNIGNLNPSLVPLTVTSTSNEIVRINSQIKRNQREFRNQSIQKITKNDINKFGLTNIGFVSNNHAKDHHTAGYIITDEGGNRHVFGESAYNISKHEITYATNKVPTNDNFKKGIVDYSESEASVDNTSGIDNYYNEIKTPAFAHTYLLTNIYSSDYQDINNNGPDDEDLGSYTKFVYEKIQNYKWRVPYKGASYNEGLRTDTKDQKASILHGEKELKYVTKIITKTHVAFIDLVDREDGLDSNGKSGGIGTVKTKYIKSIKLYSKSELISTDNENFLIPPTVRPIKTAHFEYNYSLCQNIDNRINNGGKLTLTKVYFTYRDSSMGKYTPYVFEYSDQNPTYNPKNYDIWGNFKYNSVIPSNVNLENTPQEFPYVNQDKTQQDNYASNWTLTKIKLPSGGEINIEFESDDYQYVQDQKAMQMQFIEGVCDENGSNNFSLANIKQNLYSNDFQAKYIVIKVNQNITESAIIQKYTEGLEGKSIYFNFYLNMAMGKYDHVSGYFEMEGDAKLKTAENGKRYLLIPMKQIHEEGKSNNNQSRNPISVAGWFFGRQNLNYQLFNNSQPGTQSNVVSIARSLVNNLSGFFSIFDGPNGELRKKGCAKSFKKEKSWIRLWEPTGKKLGGGSRVKKIEMYDGWDKMLDISEQDANINRYKKKYGQYYNYELENGTSSGVATFEPNMSKENPQVMPFYHDKEKLSAQRYHDLPFGSSFFPSSTVTYSRVSVKNLTTADDNANQKTKSGTVVTKFYTNKDFPTITDYTSLGNSENNINKKFETNENEVVQNMIKGLLGLSIETNSNLTLSQGFLIETNDMNGKMMEQEVYNNANQLISSVKYKYSTDPNNNKKLNSNVLVIDNKGVASNNKALGMHYDVINDFNQSYSYINVKGVSINTDFIPLGFIPIVVGMGLPESSKHTQILRTVATTKVIHKTGILVETTAFDLGSTVKTENLAWDAQTGQVLLTRTINEFDDPYFSLNFPAYWYYENMGMSSQNIDIKHSLSSINSGDNYYGLTNISSNITQILKKGDELVFEDSTIDKLWVVDYNTSNTKVKLMKRNGEIVSELPDNPSFRILRSGNRNQQMASMASITLKSNPLTTVGNITRINFDLLEYIGNGDFHGNPRIINASAIEFSDFWESQCENNLPDNNLLINGTGDPVNPYLYNVKGNWRPNKSHAYLTGRDQAVNASTRNSGNYILFNPFYRVVNNNWVINNNNWTSASKVTKYSPHGTELENKDALNRYSSAQYGYNYKLPVAVTSNAQYREIGFEGFEDYNPSNYNNPYSIIPHFGFKDRVSENAKVTNRTSHTGKNSIQVKSGKKATFVRKIDGCKDSIRGI